MNPKSVIAFNCAVRPGKLVGRLMILGVPFHARLSDPEFSELCVVCLCECGRYVARSLTFLAVDRDHHCGCRDGKPERHGFSGTRLYWVWSGMLTRCRNPKHDSFKSYGGRGIRVCREWLRFSTFREWAIGNGYSSGLQIDRINNDGDYEPGNCRWATQIQQANNTRGNHMVKAFGETKSIAEWLRDPRCNCSGWSLRRRLKTGMNPDFAITLFQGECNIKRIREVAFA